MQFTHKSPVSKVDAVSYIIHSVVSPLDGGSNIVRFIFLDNADAFGSLSCCAFFRFSMKTASTQMFWIFCDCVYNCTKFTSFSKSKSSSLSINSGVLQRAILFPFLFSFCVNILSVSPILLFANMLIVSFSSLLTMMKPTLVISKILRVNSEPDPSLILYHWTVFSLSMFSLIFKVVLCVHLFSIMSHR